MRLLTDVLALSWRVVVDDWLSSNEIIHSKFGNIKFMIRDSTLYLDYNYCDEYIELCKSDDVTVLMKKAEKIYQTIME